MSEENLQHPAKRVEDPMTWQTVAAAIYVVVDLDLHLATCGRARESGPDATLACAECGRALWMHSTRHDTCGQFCWVTERSLTDRQIGILGTIAGLPDEIREACRQALNDWGLAPYYVREARRRCAATINSAKRNARRSMGAEGDKAPEADGLPPIDPQAISRFLAVQAVLGPAGATIAREVAGGLSPAELRAWLDELRQMSLPDAVENVRARRRDAEALQR